MKKGGSGGGGAALSRHDVAAFNLRRISYEITMQKPTIRLALMHLPGENRRIYHLTHPIVALSVLLRLDG